MEDAGQSRRPRRSGVSGDDPEPYKRSYEIKTKDNPKAWADLINLCKVLNADAAGQVGESAGADPGCRRRASIPCGG